MFDLTTNNGDRTTPRVANMVDVREAEESDKPAVWQIIKAVIAGGDTYVLAPDTSEDEMISYWFTPDKHNYIAVLDGEVVGTYWLRPTIRVSVPTLETVRTWSHQMRKEEESANKWPTTQSTKPTASGSNRSSSISCRKAMEKHRLRDHRRDSRCL